MKPSYLTILLFPILFQANHYLKEIACPMVSNKAELSSYKTFCGPLYSIYNTSGYKITKMVISKTGGTPYSTTVNNPVFPYHSLDYNLIGNYTFTFYFQGNGKRGSIQVENEYDPSGDLVTCETFESPHLSPVSFFGSCGDYFKIYITNIELGC
ncbi:MAG: hypothetical protein IT249_03695 [Chitinophagaceae bacterium]|nr:hypothetical protein [Chitinophagaceae bacterium]